MLLSRDNLDDLYARYNRREFVHPDPLAFLYGYGRERDREIVGLVASSLAYGRVAQIMKSIASVLERMGSSPFLFLMNASQEDLLSTFGEFRHRFTSGGDISFMLWSAREAIARHGSLHECFCAGLGQRDETVLPALSTFVKALRLAAPGCRSGFLPSPDEGSACKRWNLFLRWMVRHDDVDPGGWTGVPPSRLIVPLDTHMHRIALGLGLTRRRQADGKTALEITRAFRKVAPEDPVRYDFVLTRMGIRKDMPKVLR
jgi:uncharacterized protein (TIGR02757 family)